MTSQLQERRAKWLSILNLLGGIGEDLYELSTKVAGPVSDPQQVGARLFRRLFSNANAFSLLIQHDHHLEAQMVLRHAVEASICLAMLSADQDEFLQHLLSDTAWTVIGQLPYWFPDEAERDAQGEVIFEQFGRKNAAGGNHRNLRWSDMSKAGAVPHLYSFYKNLSGTAAHVSGLSLMIDIVNTGIPNVENGSRLLEEMQSESALAMMAGTVHSACLSYAFILKNTSLKVRLDQAMEAMSEVKF